MARLWRDHLAPLLWAVRAFGVPLGWLGLGWLALGILAAVVPALQPWLLKLVVDHLEAGTSVATAAVLLVAALLAPRLLDPIEVMLGSRVLRRTTWLQDHRRMALGESLPDMGRLDDPAYRSRVGELSHVEQRAATLVEQARALATRAIGLAVLGGTVATVAWWLGPVLVAAVVPMAIAQYRMHRTLWAGAVAETENFREADYCTRLATDPAGAQEVRVNRLGGWLRDRHRRHFEAALATAARARRRGTPPSLMWTGLYAALTGGGIWLALWLRGDQASAGDVALVFTAAFALSGQLGALMRSWVGLIQGGRELQVYRELAELGGPTVALAADGLPAPRRHREGISLSQVRFGYDPDTPVIRGLDLDLRAGETLALVGENGAGKSTLVRLLTRMNQPQSGTITVDGEPIESYDLASLRRGIAAAHQDAARFALTARENVAISVPGLFGPARPVEHDDLVRRALRAGGADEIVDGLPAGLDTELTTRFGGSELSGGQWQRLATARAFLPDAALVIVDEPTSALDVDGERRLFDSFADLVRGRTALVISHRLSSARRADRIAFLSDGRIVEIGTHDELMAAGGGYAELFALQADAFRAAGDGAERDRGGRP